MYNVSSKYLAASTNTVREVGLRGIIRYKDGTTVNVSENDLVSGSFSITDKAVSSDKFNIGEVYVGSCSFTLSKKSRDWGNLAKAEVEFIFSILVDSDTDEWEDVKLGKFDIPFSGITKMVNTIGVVANSKMARFDKKLSKSAATYGGASYEMLQYCCKKCKMTLANTEEEIRSLVNGSLVLSITPDMGLNSYRDLIMWVAALNGCFATIDRDGNLVLREFNTPVTNYILNKDTIEKSTYYEGRMNIDNVTMSVGDYTYESNPEADLDNTLNLQTNPLLTNVGDTLAEQCVLDLGGYISDLDYFPFNIDYNGDPCLDLGDMIKFSGDDSLRCVTGYTWKFRGSSNLQGVPYSNEDSTLQSSKSSGAGGSSQGGNSFLTFLGTDEFNIRNNQKEVLIFKAYVSLLADMPCAAAVTIIGNIITEGNIVFNIYYDGDKILTLPKYYLNHLGYETFSFTLGFDATDKFEVHQILIRVLSSGGEFDVAPYDSQLVLMASGIKSAAPSWTGVYEIEESVPRINCLDLVKVRNIKDTIGVNFKKIPNSSVTDVFSRINTINMISVRGIIDDVQMTPYIETSLIKILSTEFALSGSAKVTADSSAESGYYLTVGTYSANIATYTFNTANNIDNMILFKSRIKGSSRKITVLLDGDIIIEDFVINNNAYSTTLLQELNGLSSGDHSLVISSSGSSPDIDYVELINLNQTVFNRTHVFSTKYSEYIYDKSDVIFVANNRFNLSDNKTYNDTVETSLDSKYLYTIPYHSDDFISVSDFTLEVSKNE